MAHGTPDWQQTSGVSTVYQLTDMAELAVRLGSIVSFDRAGDIVLMEDFEQGLSAVHHGSGGAGAASYLSMLHKKSGQFGLCLVAGSDEERYAYYSNYSGIVQLSKLGLETSFTIDDNTMSLEFIITYLTGDTQIDSCVTLNFQAGTIAILDDTFASVVIDTLPMTWANRDIFYTLKMVVDMANKTYRKLLVFGQQYDLSAYNLYSSASVLGAIAVIQIYHYSRAGENPTIYLDNVIMTQNEP